MDRADSFPPLPPNRYERWSRFGQWATVFYPQFLGVQVEALRQDFARMRLPYRPEFLQPAGVCHGGVIASLVDTVVVPAGGSGYDGPRAMFTIDMQLRYLAPVPAEEDAIAEGWILRRGKQIIFCDAEVRSESGTLAATATMTYKISERPPALLPEG